MSDITLVNDGGRLFVEINERYMPLVDWIADVQVRLAALEQGKPADAEAKREWQKAYKNGLHQGKLDALQRVGQALYENLNLANAPKFLEMIEVMLREETKRDGDEPIEPPKEVE